MKQTAVEWLKERCIDSLNKEPENPTEQEIGYSKALRHIIQLIDEQAKAMEEEYKANIRRAISDYMYSEGCSCCEGKDHKDHAEKIAKLLDVPKYEDGSGYNFYQFRNK